MKHGWGRKFIRRPGNQESGQGAAVAGFLPGFLAFL
jgi:hypothetical protein